MSWETGTASGHNDLFEKLLTFLSTNEDLVADGQQWEILRSGEFPYSAPAPARIGFSKWSSSSSSYPVTTPDNWPANVETVGVKIKITGTLTLPTTGTYTFSLSARDQAEVYLNGSLVASVYTASLTNVFPTTSTVTLPAGNYTLEIRYVNLSTSSSSPAGLSLGWRKPGDSSISLIPAANYSGLSLVWGSATYYNTSALDLNAQMQTREAILKGPGYSGSDEIYVTLRTFSSNQLDTYNLGIQYATGYDPTKYTWAQPGMSSEVFCLMWNQGIKYWFIANGRRFIVIAKISTTYSSMYGGFMLPYALPSEMPYPIAVGANSPINARWSIQTENNSSFWNPCGTPPVTSASLTMRRTDGTHEYIKNIFSSQSPSAFTYPYRNLVEQRASPDLSYALQPVVIFSTTGGGNVWGELDGAFAISGFSNASENTQVIDGKTYLVVQSAYRTTPTDYAAILLE